MDDLTANEVMVALAANTAAVTAAERRSATMETKFDEHIAYHRRAHRTLLSVVGLVGGAMATALGWGLTQWRSGAESAMRDSCRSIAVAQTQDARSEHAELRAADQRLATEQLKQSRELQQLAMHRLEVKREAKPK